VLGPFLTDARLVQYLSAFDSPDVRVQFSLEGMLRLIGDRSANAPHRICALVLKRIMLATSDVIGHYCLERYFRILLFFFSSGTQPPQPSWFTARILPAFEVVFLPSYFGALEDLCAWAYRQSSDNAARAMRHLLKVWPRTLSAKLPLFLKHVPAVVASLPEAELSTVVAPLFANIAHCIASDHSATATSAIKMITESLDVLTKFRPFAVTVVGLLHPAITQATGAWHQMGNLQAHLALEILRTFDGDAFEAVARKTGEDETDDKVKWETWRRIAAVVGFAHPEDVPEDFGTRARAEFHVDKRRETR
jgi:serine/threonine-protein phosphatase 2A regulatory subunit B'